MWHGTRAVGCAEYLAAEAFGASSQLCMLHILGNLKSALTAAVGASGGGDAHAAVKSVRCPRPIVMHAHRDSCMTNYYECSGVRGLRSLSEWGLKETVIHHTGMMSSMHVTQRRRTKETGEGPSLIIVPHCSS